MLLFIVLSNLICLLLPALTSARVATPEIPTGLAARQLRRLLTPSKNLLHNKRDTILLAGTPEKPGGLRLNSTNGKIAETTPFESEIDIPLLYPDTDFRVRGEIDDGWLVTVEFYADINSSPAILDRRLGVYKGDLTQGVDMKISSETQVITGEAELMLVQSGQYDVLVFQAASGVIRIPGGQVKNFRAFKKDIKRWKHGNLNSIEDVPSNSRA